MNKENMNLNLPLAGVDSEHCALILDKGLSNVKGIKTHKVELNNRLLNCLNTPLPPSAKTWSGPLFTTSLAYPLQLAYSIPLMAFY